MWRFEACVDSRVVAIFVTGTDFYETFRCFRFWQLAKCKSAESLELRVLHHAIFRVIHGCSILELTRVASQIQHCEHLVNVK